MWIQMSVSLPPASSEQHAVARVGGQAVGQSAAGCPGTDNDKVVFFRSSHRPLPRFTRDRMAGKRTGEVVARDGRNGQRSKPASGEGGNSRRRDGRTRRSAGLLNAPTTIGGPWSPPAAWHKPLEVTDGSTGGPNGATETKSGASARNSTVRPGPAEPAWTPPLTCKARGSAGSSESASGSKVSPPAIGFGHDDCARLYRP